MEEERVAAYYDELTRKGEGAARFKQGLGFSSAGDGNDAIPERSSAFSSSSSSFLSSFVRASSPSTSSKFEKESELNSIRDKLKKKPDKEPDRRDCYPAREGGVRRERERYSKRRSRSRERYRDRERRGRRRSRSRSRSTQRERRSSRSRSRSRLPKRERKSGRRSRSPSKRTIDREGKENRTSTSGVDYSRLIQGYDKMSPAERVKARMKLQLAETAEKDRTKGMGHGWERFDFDRDAPLDDEEIEDVGDDAAVVKHISQSFRFSAIEARREEQIKAAHDEAMFGAPSASVHSTYNSELEEENKKKESNDGLPTSLLSEKVLLKQRSSWRDRARKG